MKSISPESRKVESEIKDPKPLSQSSGESFNGSGKKKNNIVLYLSPIIAAALLYQVVICFNFCFPILLGGRLCLTLSTFLSGKILLLD